MVKAKEVKKKEEMNEAEKKGAEKLHDEKKKKAVPCLAPRLPPIVVQSSNNGAPVFGQALPLTPTKLPMHTVAPPSPVV